MIVLDTNQFRQLDAPHGALFTLLREVAFQRGHALAVPEMVLVEVLSHFQHEIEEHVVEIEKRRRRLHDSGHPIVIQLPNSVGLTVHHHREELRNSLTVLPHGDGDAWKALQREANRQRPADIEWAKKGAGARDVLVWLTVLSYAQRSGEEAVYFVTADGDFGRNGQLHPELFQELKNAGVPSERFRLCTRFTDVLDEFADKAEIPHDLGRTLESALAEDEVAEALSNSAGPHLAWLFRSHFMGADAASMGVPPATDLRIERSGRTVAYSVDGAVWASAERTLSGRLSVALEPAGWAAESAARPTFDIPFDVDVTFLVRPGAPGDSDRIKLLDCGDPRLKTDVMRVGASRTLTV